MRFLIRLFALLAVGLAGLVLYGRERAWERVAPSDLGSVSFDALVRSPDPNDALAATPVPRSGSGMDADVVLPLYDAPPEAVMAAIDAVIAREGGEVVHVAPLARRVVTRSRVMRFPDTNTIEAVPTERGTAIRAYARASVGQADFGTNAARLARWLGSLPLPRVATPPAEREARAPAIQ